jgi:parallel beta-helix repeat protein
VFAGCGSLTKDPCSVAVTKGSKPPKYFSDLQQAVNAAANGSTLTVSGLCEGPVFIVKRSSLTIQGIKPVTTGSGCPAGGLSPSDLSSTVTSAMDEVIKVVQSSNIKIQFLNVVDGPGDGIEFKDSSKGTAFCNCIARNDEGIVLHGAASTTMSENLVTDHLRDGILLHPGLKPSKKNTVSRNLVRGNGLNGIQLREDALQNLVTENDVIGNADDGVELSMESDKNRVLSNSVTLNGNRGVVIEDSDKNEVHGNTIAANGDAEVNQAKCVSGKKNKGNNVPPPCQ